MFRLHPRSFCKEIFVLHDILTVPSLYILDLIINAKIKVCQFPRVGQNKVVIFSLRNKEDIQINFSRLEIGEQIENYLYVYF